MGVDTENDFEPVYVINPDKKKTVSTLRKLMKDADELIERILMFDGHPNVQRLNAITVGETAQEMLSLALESEKLAVATFNAAAKECHDLGDHGSAAVFEEMVRDEETHADWFESQLDAIERIGVENYLAGQLHGE